jgi:hypothetical protein
MKKKTTVGASQSAEDNRVEAEANHLVRQLTGILQTPSSQEEAQASLGSAITRLVGIKAKDTVEAMLALQMIGTHETALECLRRAMLPNQPFEGRDLNLKHAVRLMSVFERQVAALDRHRGRGQQNVTVKYVHVAEGGQAIVGNVTRNGAAAVQEAEAPPALQAPTEMPLEIPPARQKVRAR